MNFSDMENTGGNVAKVAGILNLTPDSFYDGCRFLAPDEVREAALRIRREGADMIDVGACSTRPGSVFATEQEEIERLRAGLPVIKETCQPIQLSIDTFRPAVASFVIDNWGLAVINDVSGGSEEMYRLAAETGTGYILTYNQPVSGGDVITEMLAFFNERIECLLAAGVRGIILDPGFGFSKSLSQNYRILAHLDRLVSLGFPVMAGVSRKSMATKLLGITADEALEATTSLNTIALLAGAAWLRVHDVGTAVQTVRIMNALKKENC